MSTTPQIATPEIESALAREWRQLRDGGALHALLPSLQTRQWILDRGRVGYVTLDYRLTRAMALPGANGSGEPGVASLVEQYWSVRTLDGVQDPGWAPSLNLHLVHIRPRAVTSADVEEIVRNTLVLKYAARTAGRPGFVDSSRATLYVRALLLGTEVKQDVALFSELGTLGSEDFRASVDFRAATYHYSIGEGFTFASNDKDLISEVGIYHSDAIKQLGDQLIGDDAIPTHGWNWSGTNHGPVYDSATGLTVQDGRVL